MFKNLPYFVKGALVGFSATAIYSIVMYIIIISNGINTNDPFFYSFPMMLLMGQYFPSSVIFCLFIYSTIGAFIGFIVGLLKKNK